MSDALAALADVPYGLSPLEAAIMGGGILFAAYVRGYSGFGFSALVVGTGVLVGIPVEAVILGYGLEIVASCGQAKGAWKHFDKPFIAKLLLGGLVASPIGIAALVWLNRETISAAVSIVIFVMAAMLFLGWRLNRRASSAEVVATGMISGVVNGGAVGGLPVGILLAAEDSEPARFRAAMIAYLCLLDIVGIALLALAGLISWNAIAAWIWSLPILAVGVWAGGRGFLNASPEKFRRIVLALLMAICCLGLIRVVAT